MNEFGGGAKLKPQIAGKKLLGQSRRVKEHLDYSVVDEVKERRMAYLGI